ncbi:MAG TPA: RNA 2',3'-cyclic phosphodiesterase [Candidatus Thermoplasmatota archaeon]|nr:RNA 2',3'-cyclic phosphodiesterase [Candidatus Thermoplasmatota archaeon]
MAFRGFVAVPVPPEPALTALLEEIKRLRAEVKPVAPDHLHFTLSFLGQVPDEARDALAAAIAEAARGLAPFDVELQGVGAFPSARRPRVVWVGVRDPKPMVALALRTREALARAGHPGDDKDFRAHLTLARVKGERDIQELVRFLRAHGQDELPSVRVRETRLYKSVLGPGGPTYEALATAPLEA